jgi:uncharacterized protein YjeT (DUF2065 family)
MLTRIAIAVSLVLVAAGVVYLVVPRGGSHAKASIATAVRVGCLALGMGAWLVLASTALLWAFPFSVLASLAVGYGGTKKALHAFPPSEVRASAWLAFALGVGIAGAIAASGDSFLTYVAGPYSLLNAVAVAGAS